MNKAGLYLDKIEVMVAKHIVEAHDAPDDRKQDIPCIIFLVKGLFAISVHEMLNLAVQARSKREFFAESQHLKGVRTECRLNLHTLRVNDMLELIFLHLFARSLRDPSFAPAAIFSRTASRNLKKY